MHVVVRNEIWHGKTRFLNAIGDFSSVLIAKHYRNTQNNMNIEHEHTRKWNFVDNLHDFGDKFSKLTIYSVCVRVV